MEINYSSKRFFDNVSHLIKLQKKKVGEVETEVGVSPGYIARMTRDTSGKPGVDVVMKFAKVFDVSVDDLLSTDFTQLSASQQYVVSFIDKLIRDTRHDRVVWNVELRDDLLRLEPDINGEVHHPMFSYESYQELWGDDPDKVVSRVVFQSMAYNCRTEIWGNCYNLRLKNGVFVYMMFAGPLGVRERASYEEDIEMWLYEPSTGKQFISHSLGANPYADKLCQLYSELRATDSRPRIPKTMQLSIEAFMKDDLDDDPDSLPDFL